MAATQKTILSYLSGGGGGDLPKEDHEKAEESIVSEDCGGGGDLPKEDHEKAEESIISEDSYLREDEVHQYKSHVNGYTLSRLFPTNVSVRHHTEMF